MWIRGWVDAIPNSPMLSEALTVTLGGLPDPAHLE